MRHALGELFLGRDDEGLELTLSELEVDLHRRLRAEDRGHGVADVCDRARVLLLLGLADGPVEPDADGRTDVVRVSDLGDDEA